jgi:DNA uptake protein ComE-like DNA-binding protein
MQSQSPSTPQSQPSSETTEEQGPDLLAEASPASLEELMNRAPNISDGEADRIIEYLRAQREKFATQEATPKVKKAPRAKGPILSADDVLKDIDLNF